MRGVERKRIHHIRRDLNKLDKQGKLNKVHGGAILTTRCPNPKYRQYTLIKETEV